MYASHTQFYVIDADERDDGADVWDGAGLERHLGIGRGIVAVGTVGHTFLPVGLEVWASEPGCDEGWNHIAEATLDLASGRLGIETVDGPLDDLEPLSLDPGTYRVRVSGAGLAAATELDGGDRWRVQVWPAPPAGPRVLRWWPPWDPAGVEPQPTTFQGRLLIRAAATDARARMRWLASRGVAHLFRDADGTLWESSTLATAAGAPQLEELDQQDAERRYGSANAWGKLGVPDAGVRTLVRSLWQSWRRSRDRRPAPDLLEPAVEDGRRVLVGNTAVNRLWTMRWLGAVDGDNLHADEDGALWEWRSTENAVAHPRLVELSVDEAEVKYGRTR